MKSWTWGLACIEPRIIRPNLIGQINQSAIHTVMKRLFNLDPLMIRYQAVCLGLIEPNEMIIMDALSLE